jgi:hypothetical protein
MARQSPTNSTSSAVKIMAAANQQIHPPSNVPLNDDDLSFFANVLEEFARSQWTGHQLEIAAMMARTMCDLNKEQQSLRVEGYMIERQNGCLVENPRLRAVKSLTGDLLALRRSLGVNARARDEAHVADKKTGLAKSIEKNSPLNDTLLARPS